MKVEQLMTPSPATCGPGDNLAQVVERMWDADCGIVPVVDDEGRVVGVITDRDVAVAAATRDLTPAAIRAGDMVRGHLVACRPEDTVETAMALMRRHRVRRVVVTTDTGVLHGVVSLDDVVLSTGRKGAATASEILATLKAICARPVGTAQPHGATTT